MLLQVHNWRQELHKQEQNLLSANMPYDPDRFEDSLIYNSNEPMSILERLGYVKQLVFSRTRLEFRLIWNKVFQKEDEELGWLLNPYRRSNGSNPEATMMSSFNKNVEESYQYGYDDVSGSLGRERVTIYHRGVARKSDSRRKKREEKSFTESAIQIARYMGMGVYMTSSSFPSPFMPVNDTQIFDENYCAPQTVYTMSKVW